MLPFASLVRSICRPFSFRARCSGAYKGNPWPEVAKIAKPRVYPGLVENERFALKAEGARNAQAFRFKGFRGDYRLSRAPFRPVRAGRTTQGKPT
jgi:hypothetical protein